jgi:hypothetical protein
MKIALTGATGFVGSRLVAKLSQNTHTLVILSRNLDRARRLFPPTTFPQLELVGYSPLESGDWQQAVAGCDAVINLAGEPIAERWSLEHKKAILESRQIGTRKIVEAIAKADPKPQILINPSAIGYYGSSETATFTEKSPPGSDFLADVCQKWEAEAQKAKEFGVRPIIIRFGIVLGDGGALSKMLTPFKLFAGGPLGNGRQWFSWIHREDLVNLIIEVLNRTDLEGIFNGTAPNPVRMSQFCATLGEILHRPSWLPVPDFALELLLGEASKVILEGQQVLPEATLATGFRYQFATLKPALSNILAQ